MELDKLPDEEEEDPELAFQPAAIPGRVTRGVDKL
jgi:hypothetical protein